MSRYDDEYDYDRDNRDGSVDEYTRAVEEWRENREKEKASSTGDSMVDFYQHQHKRRIWAAKVRRHARG